LKLTLSFTLVEIASHIYKHSINKFRAAYFITMVFWATSQYEVYEDIVIAETSHEACANSLAKPLNITNFYDKIHLDHITSLCGNLADIDADSNLRKFLDSEHAKHSRIQKYSKRNKKAPLKYFGTDESAARKSLLNICTHTSETIFVSNCENKKNEDSLEARKLKQIWLREDSGSTVFEEELRSYSAADTDKSQSMDMISSREFEDVRSCSSFDSET